MKPFGEVQSKVMRAYAQSGQYHTIVESRVRLSNLVSESCPKLSRANRLVNPQISNKELQKKRSQVSSKVVKNDKLQRSRASIKGRRTLFEGRCWMMKISHQLI